MLQRQNKISSLSEGEMTLYSILVSRVGGSSVGRAVAAGRGTYFQVCWPEFNPQSAHRRKRTQNKHKNQ